AVARVERDHHAPPHRRRGLPLLRGSGLFPADVLQPSRLGDADLRRRPAPDRQCDHPAHDGDRMNALPIFLGLVAAIGVWVAAAGYRASRAADATTLARQRLARQELGL